MKKLNGESKAKPPVFPGEEVITQTENADGQPALILRVKGAPDYYRLREWDDRNGWGDRSYRTYGDSYRVLIGERP